MLGEDERGAFVEDLLEKAAEIDGVPVAVARRDLMGTKRDERALSALEVHAGSPGIAAPTWRCPRAREVVPHMAGLFLTRVLILCFCNIF